ncbi:MAG: hypothetical protein ACFBSC_04345 [Microcoleaceae cyanobacterium]
MSSSPNPSPNSPSDSDQLDWSSVQLPADLLLSVATAPMVCLLTSGRLLGNLLLGISQSSEEIFRGDRLPVLHFPQHPPESSEDEE